MRCTVAMFVVFVLSTISSSALHAQASQPPRLVNAGPVHIDFGTVNIGSSVPATVSIRNLTSGPVVSAGGGIGGAGFTSVPGGTCSGSIAPGATCVFRYEFRPERSDGTLIEDSTSATFSGGGRTQTVMFSFAGRGDGTLLHFAPRVIDYGDVLLGDIATVRINVRNLGSVSVSLGGGGFSNPNGFVGNNGCPASIAPGASCFQNYSFAPTQLGEVENSASISATTAAPQISRSYSIDVRGRGISAVPLVAFYPINFDFGDVTVGDEVSVAGTYRNLGATSVMYGGGGIAGVFDALPPTAAGCDDEESLPGVTCAFTYLFRPVALGPVQGMTSITFLRPPASQLVDVNMSGNGVGQAGRVAPLTMDFGDVRLGTTISAPVTITNTTRLPLSGFLGGTLFPPFSSTNNCPTSLAVGLSCQYTFTFTASTSSIGPRMAQTALSFTNTDGVQPVYTITLLASGYDSVFGNGFE